MSEIALFNLLKRIPDATDEEVEKAVADVASSKEVATKSDLERMGRVIVMWVVSVGVIIISVLVSVFVSVIKWLV